MPRTASSGLCRQAQIQPLSHGGSYKSYRVVMELNCHWISNTNDAAFSDETLERPQHVNVVVKKETPLFVKPVHINLRGLVPEGSRTARATVKSVPWPAMDKLA
jgi:hypothetical protein